ncbi:hypothetical protein Sipo8835_05205 [Streptomyces ipomoeae]|uniref:DUF4760 domain-containing protein n=1 Tax=Streptomyces ipomoeae TaxID=103232 RepID=A0AAE9B258_9ACTN|nr:hypothetical protein [Streptomyces ipomoeae]TQE38501.1 hypothetical protein Sipo8835_05205 [Streptomyces ipomoeae]
MGELLRVAAPVGSCIAAFAALVVTSLVWRRSRLAARLEVVRGLHAELISDSAAKDRHTLGSLHWQNREINPDGTERGEVMCAYFAMLWRFERLHAGRKVLLKEVNGRRDVALKMLDEQVYTHVAEYVCTFPVIKDKLTESNRDDRVFDGAYVKTFDQLRASLVDSFEDPEKKARLGAHTNNTEKCNCKCHEVSAKPPLPAQRPYGASV